MSILHRITGAALYSGTLLLAWLVGCSGDRSRSFNIVNGLLGSGSARSCLLGYTWALMHHMLGGIRHLIWDTGRGFALPTVNFMSNGTIVGSLGADRR